MIYLSFFYLLSAAPAPELLEQNKAFLENQLSSPSPDLRISAVQKLRDLRFPDSLGKFAPLLDDVDPEVRYEVIRSIGRLNTPEALSTLQSVLQKERDPYLISETKRNIRGIEDALKAADAKLQEQLQPKPKKSDSKKAKAR
jgi:HEAT repeat protein